MNLITFILATHVAAMALGGILTLAYVHIKERENPLEENLTQLRLIYGTKMGQDH